MSETCLWYYSSHELRFGQNQASESRRGTMIMIHNLYIVYIEIFSNFFFV